MHTLSPSMARNTSQEPSILVPCRDGAGYAVRLVLVMMCVVVACSLFFVGIQTAHAKAKKAVKATTTAHHGLETAQGEEATEDLASFLAQAAKDNNQLKAEFFRVKSALEKIPQAKWSLPDPKFSFGYFIESVETRVGPQLMRFGLSQTFPWIGKILGRIDVATNDARAAQARFEAVRLSVFYALKKAWYEYAYLDQATRILQENLDLLRFLESVARSGYAAGTVPHADVLSLQVEIGKLEERLTALRDFKKPALAAINAALSRPVGTSLSAAPDIPVMHLRLDEDKLLAQQRKSNPRLIVYDHIAAKEAAGKRLARQDYYPDLTLGVETIVTGDARLFNRVSSDGTISAPSAPPPDSGKNAWIVSASINIPLWFGRIEATAREAEYKRLAALRNRDGLADTLGADLKMAMYNYRDAMRKIELYRETLIPKAMQSFRAALSGYQTGLTGFAALVDAQRTLLEFQLSLTRAVADQAEQLSQVELLVGQDVASGVDGSLMAYSTSSSVPSIKGK
ncbi:TolC family protein [Desulfovibrio inopinatus]|uniref:TolC family protein n=1 Tax=Desulfovibrio inopinatus TaxID=102109 RepID=UPI0004183D7C|nr:TolC family protein [Desulfovibrio inopinatus]